jgi:hypothetical protein
MATRTNTRAPAAQSPVPVTPADLTPGDRVRVSGKAATVESVTGWRKDHIQVRWDEPIRSRKNARQPFIQTHGCRAPATASGSAVRHERRYRRPARGAGGGRVRDLRRRHGKR